MAQFFVYRAKDDQGKEFKGELLAPDKHAVAVHLREKGYYITEIIVSRRSIAMSVMEHFQSVSERSLSIFCQQFATLMDAGVNLVQSLSVILAQTSNLTLQSVLQDVYQSVQEGESLAQALNRHPSTFPRLMISMVEAAELGGVLDIVLQQLAEYFEKEYQLQEKIRAALVYPLFVLCLAGGAVTFIIMYVFPQFVNFYKDLRLELPAPTLQFINFMSNIRSNGAEYLGWLLAIVCGLYGAKQTVPGRQVWESLLFHLPLLGNIWRKNLIVRFSRMLSILLQGGVPLLLAVEAVRKMVDNLTMNKTLIAVENSLKAGWGLSVPLREQDFFTPVFMQMISVGEQTGNLDRVLGKVADAYERDVQHSLDCMNHLLEPVLITITAGIVGFLLIVIILPLFEVITDISRAL